VTASDPTDGKSRASRLVDSGEQLLYLVVAALLLLSAAGMCCYAVLAAAQYLFQGKALQAFFSMVNDLLVVLIIMEVLRTVARFLQKREIEVGVQDLIPFLVVAGISAARRILAIGANLSLNEAQHLEHPEAVGTALSVSWERFYQAMIELGIDAGLIAVITLALLVIYRYTLRRQASGE
jgi:uncharacterized membrane protein (DUF373 family)